MTLAARPDLHPLARLRMKILPGGLILVRRSRSNVTSFCRAVARVGRALRARRDGEQSPRPTDPSATLRNLRVTALGALLWATFLPGCAAVTERVRDRFGEVAPQVRLIRAERRAVATAAPVAFKRLDWRVAHADAARVEASSQILTSTAFADRRQLSARLTLAEVGPAETEVSLLLIGEVESRGAAGTSRQGRQGLREHGFYERYFGALQEVLREQAAAAPPEKG